MTDADNTSTATKQPWARQPGESSRWFARFVAYRNLGPERSLLGACNSYRRADADKHGKPAPPLLRTADKSWSRSQTEWRWLERAEAWDVEQIRLEEERFDRERIQNRRNRVSTLSQGLGAAAMKLQEVFNDLLAGKAVALNNRDAITLLKVATDGLRREYGDDIDRLIRLDPSDVRRIALEEGEDTHAVEEELAAMRRRQQAQP